MSPQELRSQISMARGLAKPNRWRISLNVAKVVQTGGGNISQNPFRALPVQNLRRLDFFCDQAELPGRAFSTHDIRHYGPTYKQPHQTTYPDVMLRFLVGDDMNEKYFFDAWMHAIEDGISQNLSYLKDYTSQIWIDQMSDRDENNFTYRCILYDAWPVGMDRLILDYSISDTPHRLGMAFTYRRWVDDAFNVEGAGTTGSLPGSFTVEKVQFGTLG